MKCARYVDIVLLSNPKQTSSDLRPPAGSDPLVVLLVKTALDDVRTKDMVRRIAENKPQFSDATDLKAVLDRLKNKLAKERERQQTQSPLPAVGTPVAPRHNGFANGRPMSSPTTTETSQLMQFPAQPPQQALRSKGPLLRHRSPTSLLSFLNFRVAAVIGICSPSLASWKMCLLHPASR